jgi:hypothetical protein
MTYTTRVELHSATDDDYDTLHSAMKRERFSRLITSDDGVTYHLPTAEYNYVGDRTRSEVLEAANRAADTTHLKHAVLVTESKGRSWSGLKRSSA